jgi:hypothetical protein
MTRSKLSTKVVLLASGIGLSLAAFAGSQPAAAQGYSDAYNCPAGYVNYPTYGCLPGAAYEPYDYGYGYGYGYPYGAYYGGPRNSATASAMAWVTTSMVEVSPTRPWHGWRLRAWRRRWAPLSSVTLPDVLRQRGTLRVPFLLSRFPNVVVNPKPLGRPHSGF